MRSEFADRAFSPTPTPELDSGQKPEGPRVRFMAIPLTSFLHSYEELVQMQFSELRLSLQGQLMVLTYSLLSLLSGNGSQIKNPISGRDLSCDESRRPPRGRLRGRSGPPALSSDPGEGLWKNWLAGPSLLPDEQPFSSGD